MEKDEKTRLATINFERSDGIAILTIDRPQSMNALDTNTIAELARAFAEIASDGDIRAAVITGSGSKAFIAGADIAELSTASLLEAEARAHAGQRLFTAIEELGKPVIAAINGVALGGGCEAALACTFRLSVPTARFGQPEVKLGLIPGFGGTQRLPRLVGRGPALRMILTGDPIDASEALALGLIDEIVEPEELLPRARAILSRISENAPVAVRFAMEAVHRGCDTPLAGGLAIERHLFGLCAGTSDKAEGTAAFLEKRKPHFQGR